MAKKVEVPELQYWCMRCKEWIKFPIRRNMSTADITAMKEKTRFEHEKICGSEFSEHPDLVDLDVELEKWFG